MLLSIGLGLLADAFQHVTDQALHLGERVRGRSQSGLDAHGQSRQLLVLARSARSADLGQYSAVVASHSLHLQESIRLGFSAPSLLLDDLGGSVQGLDLLGALMHACVPLLGLLFALIVGLRVVLDVSSKLFLSSLQITFCGGLHFLLRSEPLPSGVQLLVVESNLTSQGLLQLLVFEASGHFSLIRFGLLSLSFVEHIAKQVQDTAMGTLLFGLITILRVFLGLQ
mmetsp:Transcript_38613/g.94769  ORF Transcript_38613/g.94769 Transcript_38613/m.94769 type:complete len:226 (+) Transcript_38613:791-1468(+)